jgi:pimeloyl-ACP methyl ester carboxylesterase
MNYPKVILLISVSMLFIPIGIDAQQKRAGDLTIEPYVFETRTGEKVDAELGRLTVPENRKNPKSRPIELAFVRFRSTASKPGSPIVYLAGGPGGSGIETARGTRFPLFMAMREIGDVIAFDQRATGMSKPSLDCREPLGYPLDKPGDPAEILRLLKERASACVQALKAQGADLSAYNTNESADDLEDLRKALGAEKISLWSISYGTHLALTTIRRHERSLHRVVLAGVEGPAHTWKLPGQIQQNLEKINRLAKADPQVSDKVPDLIALMKTVLDRLEM